ncbi:MAG: helix-turn-helix domain-containing protein [Micrococcaceae bacterium]
MSDRSKTEVQTVGRLIKEAREWHRLSQADVAEKMNMHKRSIAAIEAGERLAPSPTLRALERALAMNEGVLDDVLNSHNPAAYTLKDVLIGTVLSDHSDAELLWELTARLQARNAEIEQLRARVAELEK